MSVTFYPGKLDSSGEQPVWVWVGDDKQFVNLPGASASEVVSALELTAHWDGEQGLLGSVPIETFEARATAYLRNSLGRPNAPVEPRVSQLPGRAMVISGGRPQGYLQQLIMRLVRNVKEAKALGATHVYAA